MSERARVDRRLRRRDRRRTADRRGDRGDPRPGGGRRALVGADRGAGRVLDRRPRPAPRWPSCRPPPSASAATPAPTTRPERRDEGRRALALSRSRGCAARRWSASRSPPTASRATARCGSPTSAARHRPAQAAHGRPAGDPRRPTASRWSPASRGSSDAAAAAIREVAGEGARPGRGRGRPRLRRGADPRRHRRRHRPARLRPAALSPQHRDRGRRRGGRAGLDPRRGCGRRGAAVRPTSPASAA